MVTISVALILILVLEILLTPIVRIIVINNGNHIIGSKMINSSMHHLDLGDPTLNGP